MVRKIIKAPKLGSQNTCNMNRSYRRGYGKTSWDTTCIIQLVDVLYNDNIIEINIIIFYNVEFTITF